MASSEFKRDCNMIYNHFFHILNEKNYSLIFDRDNKYQSILICNKKQDSDEGYRITSTESKHFEMFQLLMK